jgi:hypothetical protein
MRARFLRSLVGFLALAFAASGVAAHYCKVAHHSTGAAAPSVQVAATHHAHDGNGMAGAHDLRYTDSEPDHVYAADDAAAAGMDGAACSKCCGICTLTSAVTPAVTGQAILEVSAAIFVARSEHRSGAPLRVDPGIPKRIV